MARTDIQTNLRFTEAMKTALIEAAKANGRSMNAEIVARLQASFAAEQRHPIHGVARDIVEELAETNGLQFDEALTMAIISGAQIGVPQVLYVRTHTGITAKEVTETMKTLSHVVRDDASIYMELPPNKQRSRGYQGE